MICTNYFLRSSITMGVVIISLSGVFANKATVSSIDKKRSGKLPYDGVFSFGENKGYLQLPENYEPNKEYPFILFFHGRGGSVPENKHNLWFFRCFSG